MVLIIILYIISFRNIKLKRFFIFKAFHTSQKLYLFLLKIRYLLERKNQFPIMASSSTYQSNVTPLVLISTFLILYFNFPFKINNSKSLTLYLGSLSSVYSSLVSPNKKDKNQF